MKTATYIGGEFDPQLPDSHAIILGKGQPITIKSKDEDGKEVSKEIETYNCLVYDVIGQQHHKFNVVTEADKIRSKNEKEETYHPYIVLDK